MKQHNGNQKTVTIRSGKIKQVHLAEKIGQKDGDLTALTRAINDNTEQQVHNSTQISESTEESIIQVAREKGNGDQIHHNRKGGEKTVRGKKRKMEDSKKLKKVARKGETW